MELPLPIKCHSWSWSGRLRVCLTKTKEKSVKTILELGLSCCTKQILNFAMWSQLDPVSLLAVLISDARTWSYKKQGKECENNFGNWTVLLCWMDPDLCIRDGWRTADPQSGVSFTHEVSLQSWSVMLRLGPLKKQGEGCENYFGNWTVLLCWTDLELCTRDG